MRNYPNYDAVCFHAQQSAEKYLKAYLQEQGMPFPKTHALIELLALCVPLDGTFELQRDRLDALTDYAVQFRYPGESADREEARRAYKIVTEVRAFVRAKLGLND